MIGMAQARAVVKVSDAVIDDAICRVFDERIAGRLRKALAHPDGAVSCADVKDAATRILAQLDADAVRVDLVKDGANDVLDISVALPDDK